MNILNPTEWGWHFKDNMFVPVETDKDVAPHKILKLVSCGCVAGCSKSCGCRKLGLHCTPMCSKCEGRNCTNIADSQEEEDNFDNE